jgi:hypothetical protein
MNKRDEYLIKAEESRIKSKNHFKQFVKCLRWWYPESCAESWWEAYQSELRLEKMYRETANDH